MRLTLLSIIVMLAWIGTGYSQEKSRDQVGLVVPAFFSEGEIGESVAYLIKLAVQAELSSEDPVTKERGYGRGISYFIPAGMVSRSHEEAASLARLNGLQGTVWGYATPLADGVAIQSFLTLSKPYEDYRVTRNEVWRWSNGTSELELGPPQRAVAFRSETLNSETLDAFGSPSDLAFCPVEGGACVRFPEYQVVRAFQRLDDGAVVRRGGEDYLVRFPKSGLLRSEVIDYAGIYISYARGNLNQVIQLADRYIERHGPSDAAIDVHLYKAAAAARLGRFDDAATQVDAALGLNPVARRSLRFGMMVELIEKGRPTEESDAYFSVLRRTYGISSDFDRTYAKLPR